MIADSKKMEPDIFPEQRQMPAQREIYFDCLRLMAAFAVIALHVAAQNWYKVEAGTFAWNVFHIYDSFVRWSIPVFVMISGALFIGGPPKKLERIFRKNICRIVTAFIFWSAVYALWNLLLGTIGWKNALREFVEGPAHLWFLFMIVGLYLIVPFLRKIAENDKLIEYFVLLSLLFTFVLPYFVMVISLYSGKAGTIAGGLFHNMNFEFATGYVSYFVFGYYFSRADISRNRRIIIYLSGIAGMAVTIFAARIFPVSEETASPMFHDCMILNVMLTGVALFLLAKNSGRIRNVSGRTKDRLRKLSEYSFGAYLVHILVIKMLDHNPLFQLNTMRFQLHIGNFEGIPLNPLLSVPAIALIAFVISIAISGLLHRIPILKKYVV